MEIKIKEILESRTKKGTNIRDNYDVLTQILDTLKHNNSRLEVINYLK